jgi:hypothetical protein
MPLIEFTLSEKKWYAERQANMGAAVQAARNALALAIENEKAAMAEILADMVRSHSVEPPPPQHPGTMIRDERGAPLGLAWGKEAQEFLDGRRHVSGAVVPPKPPGKASRAPAAAPQGEAAALPAGANGSAATE